MSNELMEDLAELRSEIETERKRHDKKMRMLEQKLALLLEKDDNSDDEATNKSKNKKSVKTEESEEEEEEVKETPKKKEEVKEEKIIVPGSEDDLSFNEFEREALKAHNEYRAKHGVPPLTLTRELCSFAGEWANRLSKTCSLQHRPAGHGKGENLWGGPCGIPVDGRTAVKAWYDEIKDFRFGYGGFAMNTGHFTQVVWKNTKQLGIAIAKNNVGQWGHTYVAANYYPPGNYQGQFTENVPPLK